MANKTYPSVELARAALEPPLAGAYPLSSRTRANETRSRVDERRELACRDSELACTLRLALEKRETIHREAANRFSIDLKLYVR